jgi:7,8-dihydropterin-6-yl-methyl-4-(beta-D-ribofuranosyl)aminobenzene 5'-phosphate synthase
MADLVPLDRIQVQILVDNSTDGLSTVPSHAETELASLVRRGAPELSGDCLCCACHGFSCLVTAHRGPIRHTVLFDSGPEEYAFERNAQRLGVDLAAVEAIILSHGHFDHAGGMLRALGLIRSVNGGRSIPYYAHPGGFRRRGLRLPDGRVWPMAAIPSVEALTAQGAEVVLAAEPQTLLDRMFYLSGEIPRVTAFERGMRNHQRRTEDDQGWEPDPWIMDERSLTMNVTGKGLVVFTACSHAGVVNVLRHAQECFSEVPLHAVVGGFHLVGENEAIIPDTVAAMRPFDLKVIAAGHCTGWRALTALASTFDGTVDPSVVGKSYLF